MSNLIITMLTISVFFQTGSCLLQFKYDARAFYVTLKYMKLQSALRSCCFIDRIRQILLYFTQLGSLYNYVGHCCRPCDQIKLALLNFCNYVRANSICIRSFPILISLSGTLIYVLTTIKFL